MKTIFSRKFQISTFKDKNLAENMRIFGGKSEEKKNDSAGLSYSYSSYVL